MTEQTNSLNQLLRCNFFALNRSYFLVPHLNLGFLKVTLFINPRVI